MRELKEKMNVLMIAEEGKKQTLSLQMAFPFALVTMEGEVKALSSLNTGGAQGTTTSSFLVPINQTTGEEEEEKKERARPAKRPVQRGLQIAPETKPPTDKGGKSGGKPTILFRAQPGLSWSLKQPLTREKQPPTQVTPTPPAQNIAESRETWSQVVGGRVRYKDNLSLPRKRGSAKQSRGDPQPGASIVMLCIVSSGSLSAPPHGMATLGVLVSMPASRH